MPNLQKRPHPWDWPTNPVHIDYFKYSKNNLLNMMDSYSNWVDVAIVSHCDTKNTPLCLSEWFSQYGIPVQLISDNGKQFTSQELKKFIKTFGIKTYSNCFLSSKFKWSSREICSNSDIWLGIQLL